MKTVKKIIRINTQYEADDAFIQKWLVDVLNTNNLNCTQLAKLLHVSKQTTCAWVQGQYEPSYTTIIAICYLLKLKDDPNEIFEKMKGEKEHECKRTRT